MTDRRRRACASGWLLRARSGALVALLTLLLVAAPASALEPETAFADYLLERWTAEDGLPQITVLTLSQDTRGYLWAGTQNGIARFDGQHFVTFNRANTGLDLSMPTSSLADAEGAVWFGTPRGLLRQQAGTFSEVAVAPQPTSVRALTLWRGELLAATVDGLRARGDAAQARYLSGHSVHALSVDDSGALWAGGEAQLWRLDGPEPRSYALPDPDLRVLGLAVWQGRIAVGTRRGVWLLDPASGEFQPSFEALAAVPVPTLLADRDGNLWAASVERLQRLRPDGSEESIGDADFTPRPWLHVMFEDRDGDLWLGSQRESLLRISDSALRVLSRRQGLHDTLLWSVLDDAAGGLWVGTNDGLAHFSADAGFRRVEAGAALPDPAVYSLHRDPAGTLWLGTRAGLATLQQGRIVVDPAFAALADAQITSFADAAGALWIGSLDGLWRWADGRLSRHGAAAGAPDSRVRSLWLAGDGSLLVGTEGGLRRLRAGVWDSPSWSAPLEGSFVSSLRPLTAGKLLLTTLDKGIGVLDGEQLRLFGLADGLPSANGWTSDLIDQQVYVSTNDGAYRLPLARLLVPAGEAGLQAEVVVRAINRARGDQRMGCCNGGGQARSARQGELLYFPTTNGLIRLDTARIPPAPDRPSLAIERVDAIGRQLAFPTAVELTESPRDLDILFAGISLRHAAEIEFRYRLAGYQQRWITAVDQRAVYTGLPPGRYAFELEGRFPGRHWSRASQTLAIKVAPVWHELTLLRTLLVLAAAGLVVLGWRYSLRQAAARRHALELAVRERTEALARANERLRIANASLLEESRTDALTGIANRRATLHLLSEWPQYALLLIDIDHFKQLNDRHGHGVGDQVLVQTAALYRERLPPSVHFARWGGEEFLALLPSQSIEDALGEAEQLRAVVAATAFSGLGGQALRISCSIGVSVHPGAAGVADWQLALELADRALYRAKALGRNRVEGASLDLQPGEPLPCVGAIDELDALVARGGVRFLRPRVLRLG
jgi:diguanylate cyclase (GGDEF)-like protein